MDLLAQMATFVRVVEGKSLSAAARSQRISLPAVSRQLRALEDELGTNLVVRSTRRLHVTDAGQRWYEHCVRVLRDIDDAKDSVRSSKAVRGSLVISASLTFGASFVVPRMPMLAEKHPKLTIDLRLEDRLTDLVGEGVDVAIRAGSAAPDSPAFVAHRLLDMHRMLVATPRWLKKHGTPREPAQLARHTCIVQVTPSGIVIPWKLRRDDGKGGEVVVDVRSQLRSNAPVALRDFALADAGVAYLPDFLVADDLAQGRLRRVLPEWSSPVSHAVAIHRTELRGTPRLRAFLDAIAEPFRHG